MFQSGIPLQPILFFRNYSTITQCCTSRRVNLYDMTCYNLSLKSWVKLLMEKEVQSKWTSSDTQRYSTCLVLKCPPKLKKRIVLPKYLSKTLRTGNIKNTLSWLYILISLTMNIKSNLERIVVCRSILSWAVWKKARVSVSIQRNHKLHVKLLKWIN